VKPSKMAPKTTMPPTKTAIHLSSEKIESLSHRSGGRKNSTDERYSCEFR
jgi:hypothetical protein